MQLPEEFTARTKALLGDEWPLFERSQEEAPPVSIRLNPAKMPPLDAFSCTGAVPWASNAYYLAARPSFTLDPLFHAGRYYVQEASSMYLEQIIRQQIVRPVRALDLCAAPGGKSTQLLSVLPEGSLLVANEVIRSRASILTENITKWGAPHCIVTNNDPAEIGRLTHFFDLIVADLPCSGEGMFRKDPVALKEWSMNHVRLCSERQRRIVTDSWPSLTPGGLLIYSTCTYNREENEENLDRLCRELDADPVGTPVRFLPYKTQGEGFFIAALRKNGSQSAPEPKSCPAHRTTGSSPKAFPSTRLQNAALWKSYLTCPEQFIFFSEQNNAIAFPAGHAQSYFSLARQLKVLSAGVVLGEQKGKDTVPAHELAMSIALSESMFPVWEMDYPIALRYLRKEALQAAPGDWPKGYLLATYRQYPLGFVKNIGSRANNLYPSAWRIRK